jgi:magnesium-protoporphyrin IX monomethyl ester (oxidative) cyclase
MRVLLIQPPLTVKENEVIAVTPPLGLAYLGSVAEQLGHKVKILDTIALGFSFRQAKGDLIRIGLPQEMIKSEISQFRPDLVGISCPFSLMDEEMKNIALIVKEIDRDIMVVVGGAHPSSMPEYVLNNGNIDFVVLGEGELTFSDLLTGLESSADLRSVNGLMYKRQGKIVKNEHRAFIEDLDSLPFPAWHLLPIETYISLGEAHGSQRRKRFMPMITSRGCPGNCIFCSIHTVWGHKYRYRSPENVVKEIEKLRAEYGIDEIHFEDDNLTLSRQRMMGICGLLISKNLGIRWTTPNGVAVSTLDFDLLKRMKDSGCFQLNLGIESGDPRVLKEIINKPLNLEKVKKVVGYCRTLGIWSHGFFVIGFPGESFESIRRTIQFSKDADLDSANFFIAAPYPGTRLNALAQSIGLIDEKFELSKLRTMDSSINTTQFSSEEMIALQKKAYMEFIRYRAKKEFLYGYFFLRLLRSRSSGDLSFFMQKVTKRIIPTIRIKTKGKK